MRQLAMALALFTVLAGRQVAAQQGLRGDYYTGTNFERRVATRIDPAINFNWRNQRPITGLGISYYSIRWTGKLLAPVTGRYTFFAKVDDGIRIWVGNHKVMDAWQLNDSKSFKGSVVLQGGQYYDFRVDFFNDMLEGEIVLYWQRPDYKKPMFSFSEDIGEPITTQYFSRSIPAVKLPLATVKVSPKKPAIQPAKPNAGKNLAKRTPKPVTRPVAKPVVMAKPVAMPAKPATSQNRPEQPPEAELKLSASETFVLRSVQFEQSSYVLLPESTAELDKLVRAMKANPKWRIEVAGHTDNVGDPRLNRALSENRAKVVATYLIRHGIAEERIRTKGYGGSEPLADNATESGRSQNRRVAIKMIE
ncbi:PA14 domain-containing protein [Spirosoma sp. SC4-14]|uniref:PA14 domain-containing protein n=1 Tax=Spirosoma sp. SC4-14 TaxID=3128900 RepID=UPI0030D3E183